MYTYKNTEDVIERKRLTRIETMNQREKEQSWEGTKMKAENYWYECNIQLTDMEVYKEIYWLKWAERVFTCNL